MNRSPHHRLLLRMARFLEHDYQRRSSPEIPCDLPLDRWNQVRKLQRQAFLARHHRYHAAAKQCQQRLQQVLHLLSQDCSTLSAEPSTRKQPASAPNLRLLHDELQFLFDEFEQVELDWNKKEIAVQTERIVLEGMDLGPFQIRLRLWHLGESQPYQVIALEPYPPSSNDDITHPHVQSRSLCEGEGKLTVAQALDEGRLGEFFVLVRQILRTYNDGSAYHPLSEWHDSPCSDCGSSIDPDDTCSCDRCQTELCSHCTNCCHCCSDTLCTECHDICEACHSSVCDRCLGHCTNCNEPVCSDCLQEDRCPPCSEQSLENDNEQEEHESMAFEPTTAQTSPPQTATTPSHAPVQPLCLGEVGVPA